MFLYDPMRHKSYPINSEESQRAGFSVCPEGEVSLYTTGKCTPINSPEYKEAKLYRTKTGSTFVLQNNEWKEACTANAGNLKCCTNPKTVPSPKTGACIKIAGPSFTEQNLSGDLLEFKNGVRYVVPRPAAAFRNNLPTPSYYKDTYVSSSPSSSISLSQDRMKFATQEYVGEAISEHVHRQNNNLNSDLRTSGRRTRNSGRRTRNSGRRRRHSRRKSGRNSGSKSNSNRVRRNSGRPAVLIAPTVGTTGQTRRATPRAAAPAAAPLQLGNGDWFAPNIPADLAGVIPMGGLPYLALEFHHPDVFADLNNVFVPPPTPPNVLPSPNAAQQPPTGAPLGMPDATLRPTQAIVPRNMEIVTRSLVKFVQGDKRDELLLNALDHSGNEQDLETFINDLRKYTGNASLKYFFEVLMDFADNADEKSSIEAVKAEYLGAPTLPQAGQQTLTTGVSRNMKIVTRSLADYVQGDKREELLLKALNNGGNEQDLEEFINELRDYKGNVPLDDFFEVLMDFADNADEQSSIEAVQAEYLGPQSGQQNQPAFTKARDFLQLTEAEEPKISTQQLKVLLPSVYAAINSNNKGMLIQAGSLAAGFPKLQQVIAEFIQSKGRADVLEKFNNMLSNEGKAELALFISKILSRPIFDHDYDCSQFNGQPRNCPKHRECYWNGVDSCLNNATFEDVVNAPRATRGRPAPF